MFYLDIFGSNNPQIWGLWKGKLLYIVIDLGFEPRTC